MKGPKSGAQDTRIKRDGVDPPTKPNQDTAEILSLLACSDNLTDQLARSAGDKTQTNGLERLKRVAVTWAAKGVLRELGAAFRLLCIIW